MSLFLLEAAVFMGVWSFLLDELFSVIFLRMLFEIWLKRLEEGGLLLADGLEASERDVHIEF